MRCTSPSALVERHVETGQPEDAQAIERDPQPAVATDPAPVATPAAAPVAVLVRSRGLTDKLLHLLATLRPGLGYDVLVCADETDGPWPADAALPTGALLRHDAAEGVGRGLVADRSDVPPLWFFGDYVFHAAFAARPDHSHYLLLDEAVDLTRGNPLFIEGLARRLAGDGGGPYDLVASWLGPRPADWLWHPAAAAAFGEARGIFPAIVALSRAALLHVQEWRRRELAAPASAPVFWEALLPSALAAGFRCADLNALLPGSWDAASFPSPEPLLLGRLPPLPPGVELVFPVADERAYLAWLLAQSQAAGTLPDLIGRLAPGGDLAVSEPVRAWFLHAALAALP